MHSCFKRFVHIQHHPSFSHISFMYHVCFRYRWYILLLYFVLAAMSCNIWNTWGPIESSARAVFGWSAGTISLLSDWGVIVYVIFVFPSSYILDVFGEYLMKRQVFRSILRKKMFLKYKRCIQRTQSDIFDQAFLQKQVY